MEKPDFDVVNTVGAADALAKLISQITEDRDWPGLTALQAGLEVYENHRYPNQGQSTTPFTAIEEQIAQASWVLRRLVALHGFQATLTVYGGDFEEHGTNVHRGVRVNVLRRSLDLDQIRAITEFAEDHGCDAEWSQEHGVTLRLRPIIEAEVSTPKVSITGSGGIEGVTSTAVTL
jgi:hypothetical protein